MADKDMIEKWAAITDPVEALEELIDNQWCIGSDPYYRDLNEALWKMAERVAKLAREKVV